MRWWGVAPAFVLFALIARGDAISIPVIPANERVAADQFQGAIASNGHVALDVWTQLSPKEMFAARIDSHGLLDTEPIRLGPDASEGSQAIVATPEGWVIATLSQIGLRIRFVGSDGYVAPARDFSASGCGTVKLAASGSRVLLLMVCRATTIGTLLDGRGNILQSGLSVNSSADIVDTAIVAEGDHFLVLTGHRSLELKPTITIGAQRVTIDGTPGAEFVIAQFPGYAGGVLAAFDGRSTTALWVMEQQMYSAVIGSTSSAPTAPLKLSDVAVQQVALAASAGRTWLLYAIAGPSEVHSAELSGGSIIGESQRLDKRGFGLSAAVIDGQLAAAWMSWAAQKGRRVFARVSDRTFAVSPNAPDRLSINASATPATAAAAWSEAFGSVSRIAVSGLDRSFQLLPRSGSIISNDAAYWPQIAAGNDVFLVAWYDEDSNTMMGRRLSSSLEPMDASPFPIASSVAPGAIAFDGSNWLIAFVRLETYSYSVAAVRVSSTGTLLDSAPIEVSSPFGYPGVMSIDVDWDGAAFRVVWESLSDGMIAWRYAPGSARVRSDGTVFEQSQLTAGMGNGEGRQVARTASPRVQQGRTSVLLAFWRETELVGRVLSKRDNTAGGWEGRHRAVFPAEIALGRSSLGSATEVAFDGVAFHLFWLKFDDLEARTWMESIVSESPVRVETHAISENLAGAVGFAGRTLVIHQDLTTPPTYFWHVH